jgi:hypothetical protein
MTTLFLTGIHTRSVGEKRTYVYSARFFRNGKEVIWYATVRVLDGGQLKGSPSGQLQLPDERDKPEDLVRIEVIAKIERLSGIDE